VIKLQGLEDPKRTQTKTSAQKRQLSVIHTGTKLLFPTMERIHNRQLAGIWT